MLLPTSIFLLLITQCLFKVGSGKRRSHPSEIPKTNQSFFSPTTQLYDYANMIGLGLSSTVEIQDVIAFDLRHSFGISAEQMGLSTFNDIQDVVLQFIFESRLPIGCQLVSTLLLVLSLRSSSRSLNVSHPAFWSSYFNHIFCHHERAHLMQLLGMVKRTSLRIPHCANMKRIGYPGVCVLLLCISVSLPAVAIYAVRSPADATWSCVLLRRTNPRLFLARCKSVSLPTVNLHAMFSKSFLATLLPSLPWSSTRYQTRLPTYQYEPALRSFSHYIHDYDVKTS